MMPESVGRCAVDLAGIAAITNEAQQRLLTDPLAPDEGWWGSQIEVAFSVSQAAPYFTTPYDIARPVAANVCRSPVPMRNGLFEYLRYTSGSRPSGCNSQTNSYGQPLEIIERDLMYTLSDFVPGNTLRAYALNPADVNSRIFYQGLDTNGKQVYSEDVNSGQSIPGEYVTLADPFADSAYAYSKITGIQKDVLWGNVDVYQVDSAGNEVLLTTLRPQEQTALYRRYYVNGLPANCCGSASIQILTQCRVEHVRAYSDSDYLVIQSIPALIDECMSIRYSRMDSTVAQQLSQTKHQSALRLLCGQIDQYRGKTNIAIGRSLFGSDALALQAI